MTLAGPAPTTDPWEHAARAFEPPPVFETLGFVPNPGPQTRFLELPDNNLDVLYGGAAGGSKSTSLLMYALRSCVRYPGLQAFWFRRSFPSSSSPCSGCSPAIATPKRSAPATTAPPTS